MRLIFKSSEEKQRVIEASSKADIGSRADFYQLLLEDSLVEGQTPLPVEPEESLSDENIEQIKPFNN